MELLTVSIIIIVFSCVFTLEVIAPASKNNCDRRWMVLASGVSLFQSITTVAAGLIIVATYNLFIHADLKTPYWLGYLLQRPEMHRVHHKHLHHAQNYGLSIWDLLFGTFNNPDKYIQNVGFDEKRETRIYDMLKTKDVYKN